jgi:hypothetical protein
MNPPRSWSKNERIKRAAIKIGPKFSTIDIYAALHKSIPMNEVGARLSRLDIVRPTDEEDAGKRRIWVLVDGDHDDR